MSDHQKALDDAFLEAALEEVTRNTKHADAQPRHSSQLDVTPEQTEQTEQTQQLTSRLPALKVAAALLLGISAVVAVQMMSGGETTTWSPAQDPVPEYGPVIKPRDAQHARELLSQVHAISMDVQDEFPAKTRLTEDPWVFDNRVILTDDDDNLATICERFADGIDDARPLGPAYMERNEISLHVPGGRLVCAYNFDLERGIRLEGYGAWRPSQKLKAWVSMRESSAEAKARRMLGIVRPADIQENSAWLKDLTTVRAEGLGDQHMGALLGITGLQVLDLSRATISVGALQQLKHFTNLRVLVLDKWSPPAGPSLLKHLENAYEEDAWRNVGRALRECAKLEVLSLRESKVLPSAFFDPKAPTSLAAAWPNLQLLDIAWTRIDYETFAQLRTAMKHAVISHPSIHVTGELRLQHLPYNANSLTSPHMLRAVVEFAQERGLAIASVDVQRTGKTSITASDGSRGTSCTIGPGSKILHQGREDYGWQIETGQSISLFPATDLERVVLLPNKGANWIAFDETTELLVERFLGTWR